jgi:hypothetical protein
LLPHQFHGLDSFGPERRVGFVSGGGIVKLEKVGSTEGLAVKELEGRLLPGAIDESGARVGSATKSRIVVVAKAKIQNEVFAKVNFVLSVNRKYIRGPVASEILDKGLKVIISLILLKVVLEFGAKG